MQPANRALIDNRLLRALKPADLALLLPALEQHDAAIGDVLYEHGQPVTRVYFPGGPSLVSYVILTENGATVEVAMIGREGAVGGVVSHGFLPAYAQSTVRAAGPMLTMDLRLLEQAKARSPALANLFVRYADCLVAQLLQSAACNATHSVEQRLAKWMIAARERTERTRFDLPQEELGAMLGVGRSFISRVIASLKQKGLIKVGRGYVEIADEEGLQSVSCRCNDTFKEHFDTVLNGVYPPDDD